MPFRNLRIGVASIPSNYVAWAAVPWGPCPLLHSDNNITIPREDRAHEERRNTYGEGELRGPRRGCAVRVPPRSRPRPPRVRCDRADALAALSHDRRRLAWLRRL